MPFHFIGEPFHDVVHNLAIFMYFAADLDLSSVWVRMRELAR